MSSHGWNLNPRPPEYKMTVLDIRLRLLGELSAWAVKDIPPTPTATATPTKAGSCSACSHHALPVTTPHAAVEGSLTMQLDWETKWVPWEYWCSANTVQSVFGHCMYRQSNIQQFLRSAHTVYLGCVCGSENKQWLFPYTALTDWFL